MPLHPQVDGFLKQMAAAGGPAFHQMSVADCRAAFAGLMAMMPPGAAALASVNTRQIPGGAGAIDVRIYTPPGAGPFPLLCFFHGGGWVIGDLETHDAVCRELASGAACIVVAVAYRLAPEHRFPAAPEDCVAAVKWLAANAASLNADPARLAVGGDSAGGNLAAVVAQRLRDTRGPALCAQLLIYPVTRLAGEPMPSMIENAQGYLLEAKDMEWFVGHYLPSPNDGARVDASPALAENLAGLPPALVITAEFDPLRDEGEAYARALSAAGVPTVLSRYDGAIHAFYSLYAVMEPGRQALDESIRWLRERFRR